MEVELKVWVEGHEILVKAECSLVNNGIGSYEFWGAKGFDSRMEFEVEIIESSMIRGAKTRKLDFDRFSREHQEALEEAVSEKCRKIAKDNAA